MCSSLSLAHPYFCTLKFGLFLTLNLKKGDHKVEEKGSRKLWPTDKFKVDFGIFGRGLFEVDTTSVKAIVLRPQGFYSKEGCNLHSASFRSHSSFFVMEKCSVP